MGITKIVEKCGTGMASAWNDMKQIAANTKQDGRITEAKNKIAQMTLEIGNLTVLKLDEGMETGEEITERYDVILEARKEIEAAKAEKEIANFTCPHCGEHTTAGMHFCGYCGKEL